MRLIAKIIIENILCLSYHWLLNVRLYQPEIEKREILNIGQIVGLLF